MDNSKELEKLKKEFGDGACPLHFGMDISKLFEYTACNLIPDVKMDREVLNLVYDRVWQIATDKYIGVTKDEEFLITPAFTIKVNEADKLQWSYREEFPYFELNCIYVYGKGPYDNGWSLAYAEPTTFYRPTIYSTWNIAPRTPEILRLSNRKFWGWNYGHEQIDKHRSHS